MDSLFDCEVENCTNKTEQFLCEYHSIEATNQNTKITICEKCNKILKIERRMQSEPRYVFTTDCMKCNPQIVLGNPEEPTDLPTLPEE